ncbi:MAG: uroporphyrinogen-III C-methyltransferase [Planctomycetales bacterium]|nr:uroporphyrinogen-III C-methyltransferase [Planctomycetales bacterium]
MSTSSSAHRDVEPHASGMVYLVGAGPGDPRLITLRGVQCLARADLVLYDYLVNPRVLEHTRADAECICTGRHGHGKLMSQPELNRRVVEAAREGRTVVRLKAGDPAIFARAAEEIDALDAAGLRFEVVPGITAALAAGSYAGIAITDRNVASAVAFVTGREQAEKATPALDYGQLADFPGTIVVYMGVTTAGQWTSSLIAAGKAPETPAAIVRRCSWADQLVVRCTLGTVAEEIDARQLRPPALVIVGTAVAGEAPGHWFATRPLAGRRVLVTRPREQAASLAEPLEDLGAEVLIQPAIEIAPPDDWRPVDDAIARLAEFDWLVFSSANGVSMLLDRLSDSSLDLRTLGGLRIAAIGPGTAAELRRYRLRPDVVPESFRAESLAASLSGEVRGRRCLLVRASRGRQVLAESLVAAGADVEEIVVYRSVDIAQPDDAIREALEGGHIDWVTVTSSAIARNLAQMFGSTLGKARLVSISPITTATLTELGHPASAEANPHDMPGVVAALLEDAQ